MHEENTIQGVIQKSKMKINEMTVYANQLKKNVMKRIFIYKINKKLISDLIIRVEVSKQ